MRLEREKGSASDGELENRPTRYDTALREAIIAHSFIQ
jgi:hypothetical protein